MPGTCPLSSPILPLPANPFPLAGLLHNAKCFILFSSALHNPAEKPKDTQEFSFLVNPGLGLSWPVRLLASKQPHIKKEKCYLQLQGWPGPSNVISHHFNHFHKFQSSGRLAAVLLAAISFWPLIGSGGNLARDQVEKRKLRGNIRWCSTPGIQFTGGGMEQETKMKIILLSKSAHFNLMLGNLNCPESPLATSFTTLSGFWDMLV